ncbi:MAG: mannose-1-phosphate guanylyltransferase/mannose-6-phosphate isomerase [Hyphomicrobiales bacterium]|nr:mannose-1-phosphate guanylyltransferase/mannose-6-phosphate isomerase [Hyphomicrobiales bacterium]MBV8662220.1 mannose-1-phosphate guanylyltransferase/mannose-6-phosphate isomerase [Hyphomicrobiales bacterium]
MAKTILPVIMCGGAGTRMWPESRETMPKQFIALIGAASTFQETVRRVADPLFAPPIVVTNRDYRFLVKEQLAEIGVAATIVIEPSRRDSGPAIAVTAALAARQDPETVVAVFAADHVITEREAFLAACRAAAGAAAAGKIVTLGVTPSEPATGYGYIKPGAPAGADGALAIEAFVEKPDRATAERYVADGYLWNSGNFFFRADVMREEIATFEPEMAEAAEAALAKAKRDLGFLVLDAETFATAPKKSIDYAVMERTRRAAVVPADLGWSDVGSWDAVLKLSERDEHGNAVLGHGVALDSRNVLIRSQGVLTAAIGLKDVVIVATEDAVLALASDQGDKVKHLVDALKRQGRREAVEHKRIYRPWGYYQSIDSGPRYQVKRIVVTPGGRLSLQKHHHRAEHWVVVKGAAEVTRGEEVKMVHENESIFLPIGVVHRLANPGKINLELIEVQTGSYLGEDDIVRIEDVYNREGE